MQTVETLVQTLETLVQTLENFHGSIIFQLLTDQLYFQLLPDQQTLENSRGQLCFSFKYPSSY